MANRPYILVYKDPLLTDLLVLVPSIFALKVYTWRIIPASKWWATPICKPWKGYLEGEQPNSWDLLTGMILQVGDEILISYMGIIAINHEIRIRIKQPGFNGK